MDLIGVFLVISFIGFMILGTIGLVIFLAILNWPSIAAFIMNKQQWGTPNRRPVPVKATAAPVPAAPQPRQETKEERRIRLIHEEEENQICEMKDRDGNVIYRTTADKFWGYKTDWSYLLKPNSYHSVVTEEKQRQAEYEQETQNILYEAQVNRELAELDRDFAEMEREAAEAEAEQAETELLILAGLLL